MDGNRELDGAEVRAEVTAGVCDGFDDEPSDLGGKGFALAERQRLHVHRRRDRRQQRIRPARVAHLFASMVVASGTEAIPATLLALVASELTRSSTDHLVNLTAHTNPRPAP